MSQDASGGTAAYVLAPSRTGRRQLLTRGMSWTVLLATSALTAGCTPGDPRIAVDTSAPTPRPTRSSTPRRSTVATSTPAPRPPEPALITARNGEQALALLAAGILAGPHRTQLGAGQRRALTATRDGHRAHVAALSSPQPSTRPDPSGSPDSGAPVGAGTTSLTAAIRRLASDERRQAARLRRSAVRAVGYDALLLASMAVAAEAYAGAVTGRPGQIAAPSSEPHPAMPAMSDVAALQAAVRQLHAMVYGYQLALGRLSVLTAAGRRARAALAARRRLRDRLVQALTARGAEVPAAAGAYVPSVEPTSARRAGTLVRRMEVAFQPFCGLWLASSASTEDRRLALESLTATVAHARSWGATTGAWPGWRD